MSQSKIKLNATEEVQEFVNAASRCDFDIDVYYNRFLIDAKSILGVLSLDLTRELTVDCHGLLQLPNPRVIPTIRSLSMAVQVWEKLI